MCVGVGMDVCVGVSVGVTMHTKTNLFLGYVVQRHCCYQVKAHQPRCGHLLQESSPNTPGESYII